MKVKLNHWLLKFFPKRFVAVTIGQTIYVRKPIISTRLLKHEMAHVRQWEQYGIWFLVLYLWESIKHGYTNNRFEIEAREAERK